MLFKSVEPERFGVVYSRERGRASICDPFDQKIYKIINLQPAGEDLISMHLYSPALQEIEIFPLSDSTFADYDDLIIRSTDRANA